MSMASMANKPAEDCSASFEQQPQKRFFYPLFLFLFLLGGGGGGGGGGSRREIFFSPHLFSTGNTFYIYITLEVYPLHPLCS